MSDASAIVCWVSAPIVLAALAHRLRIVGQRCAREHGRLLIETARRLDTGVARLAPLLGVSDEEIARWIASGVPRPRFRDVRRLARQAVSLRRRLDARHALRLLELHQRSMSVSAEAARRLETAAERRYVSGIAITSR